MAMVSGNSSSGIAGDNEYCGEKINQCGGWYSLYQMFFTRQIDQLWGRRNRVINVRIRLN